MTSENNGVIKSEKSDEEELESLRREVQQLRKYKILAQGQTRGLGAVAKFSTYLWAGSELSFAIRNWIEARDSSSGQIPVSETADLLAAIIRRFIRVGLIAMILALVPTMLLFWQNLIMKDQYGALIKQIEEQRGFTQSQQITAHLLLLLDDDRKKFWAAVSYFRSSPSIKN